MARFLCLQRRLPAPYASARHHEPADYEAWFAEVGDHVVDVGGRLHDGVLVTADDQPGRAAEPVGPGVGGYMVVEAEDRDAAVAVARTCPGLVQPGSGVEVLQITGPAG